MSEEVDFEELSREVEDLRRRLNSQRLYLGALSVIVILLLIQSFVNNPSGFFYLAIMALIIIPLALIIDRLEQRGL